MENITTVRVEHKALPNGTHYASQDPDLSVEEVIDALDPFNDWNVHHTLVNGVTAADATVLRDGDKLTVIHDLSA